MSQRQPFAFRGYAFVCPSLVRLAAAFFLICLMAPTLFGQGRQNFTLFGDVRIEDPDGGEPKPQTFDVFLYKGGNLIGRQKLGNNGRYRFMNLLAGVYEVAIEIENSEVTRFSILIAGQYADDVRRDINLTWRSLFNRRPGVTGVISAHDTYVRPEATKSIHQSASRAIDRKNFSEAVTLLRQVIELDKNDYQAWFELGAVYFIQKDPEEAEKSFVSSLAINAKYFPSAVNLGRVRLARKNYEGAVDALQSALSLEPMSAYANYLAGESYLQSKQGSKAVVYFQQALKLDPTGMADAHLRLASLYNAAGYKAQAAAEYEAFLKKRPDYSDRKRVEEYIANVRKQKKP